jgi:hypothetical protein
MTLGDLGEERMHFQGDKQEKMRQVFSFVMALNTGLAPIVGQQVTLDAGNLAIAWPRFELLRERAAAHHCQLVVHGFIGGRIRGFFYVIDSRRYQSDRSAVCFRQRCADDGEPVSS